VKADLIQTQTELEETEDEIRKTGEQFEKFQELRAYLASLVGCLREKLPMVKEVEEALMVLEMEQAQRVFFKRREDLEDQLLEFVEEGSLISVGTYQVSEAFRNGSASQTAKQELDEFGRERNYFVKADRARREEKRKRRREQALARIQKRAATPPSTGGVTDFTPRELQARDEAFLSGAEESDSEIELKTTRQRKLMEAAEVIFGDADEEYTSLGTIKKLFEDWKRDYPEQYATVYCSLTVPQLLQPLVRCEMLSWDPLLNQIFGSSEEANFELFDWYRALFDYAQGIPTPSNAPSSEIDPDENLVPKLVEDCVFPRVIQIVSAAYDPFSSAQSNRLLAVITEVLLYEPPKDKVKEFFQALLKIFKSTVAEICVPLLSICDKTLHFMRKQLFLALKIYKNIALYAKFISPQTLASIAVEELVGKKMVPAMIHILEGTHKGKAEEGQAPALTHQEILRICEELASITPEQWHSPECVTYWDLLLDLFAKLVQDFMSHCKNKITSRNRTFTQRLIQIYTEFGDKNMAKLLAQQLGLKMNG